MRRRLPRLIVLASVWLAVCDDEGERVSCGAGTRWNGTQCVAVAGDGDADAEAGPDADAEAGLDGDLEADSDRAPEPGPRAGGPCESHADCGLEEPYHMCARVVHEVVFPNGYCTVDGCDPPEAGCPPDTECTEIEVSASGFVAFCMRVCAGPQDCRSEEGYRCEGGVCVP